MTLAAKRATRWATGRRSTSPLSINGDRPLGPAARLAYLAGNAARNAMAARSGPMPYARFTPAPGVAFAGTPSPSRFLCEQHLASIDWPSVARAAGAIRMHEMGCGSGRAGRLVAALVGAALRYRGFDVQRHPAWDDPMPGARLATFDGDDFAGTIAPDDNFFFSQSAAEHIPNDLDYFAAVAGACARSDGPTLQIHYLPAPACLRLYLFHGLRQYPAGALGRLAALQAPDARCTVVALGGPAAIDLHWRAITWPMLRRRKDGRTTGPEAYRQALVDAVAADGGAPPHRSMFWAFIVRRGDHSSAAQPGAVP